MELLVRIRNGLPELRNRPTNSGAPGTGWPSWTSTPSMSVSHDSTGLRSVMPSSVSGPRCRPGSRRRTATLVTEVPGGNAAQRGPGGARRKPLLDQFTHHGDEARIVAGRRRPGEVEAEFLGRAGGLVVEVPQNLDVVGDEPDRADHHTGGPGRGQHAQVVGDVRLQPRYPRGAGPALPDQIPGQAG